MKKGSGFLRIGIILLCICTTIIIELTGSVKVYACQSSCVRSVHMMDAPPEVTPTPGGTSDSQQIITMSQNDVSIANSIIAWSGLFLAILATAVSIAVFLGIRELRMIQQARAEFEKHIERVSRLENDVEERLKQLANRIEQESQILIGVSYDFSVATDAYKSNNFERAIEYYLRVLDLQPANLRVLERLGRSHTNLNQTNKAIHYFEQALSHDPKNVPALRGLSTAYRYIDKDKSLDFIKKALELDSLDNDGWNYIGLLYRDIGSIDDAILSHEKSLAIKKIPETEFFLSILYAHKGDKVHAKLMALAAQVDSQRREHAERLRSVWGLVIKCGVCIIENNEEEALTYAQEMSNYVTTERTLLAVMSHVHALLQATGHKDWISKFDDTVKLRGAKNAKA